MADVCEAILAASWIAGGLPLALKCLKAMGFPMKELDRWGDLKLHIHMDLPPSKIALSVSALERMQEIIGSRLAKPEVLTWALVSLARRVRVLYGLIDFRH